jgi:hypothetical protein
MFQAGKSPNIWSCAAQYAVLANPKYVEISVTASVHVCNAGVSGTGMCAKRTEYNTGSEKPISALLKKAEPINKS